MQLTSDGHRPYLRAIEEAFGDDIDCAMSVKTYGEPSEPAGGYSPGVCICAEKEPKMGSPDPDHP